MICKMKYRCTKFPEKPELTAVLEKQEPTESIAKMVHFCINAFIACVILI